MGWLLVYYIVIVYLVPVTWALLDWIYIDIVWFPGYTFDRHGLSLVYAGSVFLAYGALIDNFLTKIEYRAHLVAFTHLGLVLLSTGVVFQASSMIQLNNIPPGFRLLIGSNLLFTEPVAREIIRAVDISTPFLAPPLMYLAVRFQSQRIPQEYEQLRLDSVRWGRKLEQPKETECVIATDNPNARVRVLVSSGHGPPESFVAQLEYHTQSGWELVARFDHDENNEIAEDITKNGLRMKLYRNGRTEGGIQVFPEIDLVDAPSYCEIYLQRHVEELLQWFHQKEEPMKGVEKSAKARLTLWGGASGRKTIRGDSADLRHRQAQITAWRTEDTSTDILLRAEMYPMNPPPKPKKRSK